MTTFNETGFRAFYHTICALELNDKLRNKLKNCPGIEKASHGIFYGYIDTEKGLMLEVLGTGKETPKSFYFREPYEGRRITIHIGEVEDLPFLCFKKLEPRFQKQFAPRIEKLKKYDSPVDLEKSRSLDFLDHLRSPQFPDDIQVLFVADDLKPEVCWVRLTGLGDHCFYGTLLNQPYQDFGKSLGEQVSIQIFEPEDKDLICVANLDDGADGKLVKIEAPLSLLTSGHVSEDDHADFQMAVGKMDTFNYAFYQNNIRPIRDIRLLNRTGDPAEGLSLRIHSDFDFFESYEMPLPAVPSGKPVLLEDPKLTIHGQNLADLTEMVTVAVTVELCRGEAVLCTCQAQMTVLAYDQWQGGSSYRDLLTAFVLPNHPAIPALLREAANRLEQWGKPTSLEGYQRKDPNRVRDLAAAAYAAIQKKNIVYAEPPTSFSVAGQRIRTPETILEQRLGTCMDLTLLYTACLEAMGLHPILVMMQGHIFAGVWLRERSLEEQINSDIILDNLKELTSRIDNGADEMTFVECTAMCSGKEINFEAAEALAKQTHLLNETDFNYAIDVELARKHNIRPLASRIREGGIYQIEVEEKQEGDLTAAPTNLGLSLVQTASATPKKITTKRELWESKLLDLSQRNMLLNLPLNASVMPIMSSHVDELEDALADGQAFHLLPAADWITGLTYLTVDENGKESQPANWLLDAIRERGIFELTQWPAGQDFDYGEKFRQEFRSHRLYTFSGAKQLDRELTTIYRAARSSQQENGVSSLYLAIGLLRWFSEPDSSKPSYAPLILLPIEIIRKSANQGYSLHARDEEPHFNMTLLEMLKQNYHLDIAGLDPLPVDEYGIDIKRTFSLVRGALYTLKGWDVIESCVIGNFSFAQFAMWNDLHTAGDLLDNSKVVRSLMKGYVDWDLSEPNTPAEEKDSSTPLYLPITVDATQLKAIEMAAGGSTFVLHGPPGTGKSQTITGMVANLMAQGKRVLFVAEKMAALSVVQRRLSALGVGDFCLEVHLDKANKKQVLSQLEKALDIRHPDHRAEYDELHKQTLEQKARLDGYAKHLHAVHRGGYSLRELVDLYESVRNEAEEIHFDSFAVGQLSRSQIQRHLSLLGQLTAAGEALGDIKSHPLKHLKIKVYGADLRMAVRNISQQYIEALQSLQAAATEAAQLLHVDKPEKRSNYADLEQLVLLYEAQKQEEPPLLHAIDRYREELQAYYQKAQEVSRQEQKALETWEVAFLDRDMSRYLTKHEAASKKFFGKTAAMTAVVADIQAYAKLPITFESIPLYLQDIIVFQEQKRKLQDMADALPASAKPVLEAFPTAATFKEALEEVAHYRQRTADFPGGPEAIQTLNTNPKVASIFENYQAQYQQARSAEAQLNEQLGRRIEDDEVNWIEADTAFCQYLRDEPAALKNWGLYSQVREACADVGLQPAIEAYENGLAATMLPSAYKKGFYRALINEIIGSDDILSRFSGMTFNESVQQFKQLDDRLLQLTKHEIFYQLASRVPSSWTSPEMGMELSLLRKAIGSHARGISIRTLFDRIANLLPILCPCMLMSPNSVAQYLAQKNDLFDVVIFDEASQLPTCKAVGALARAKNAVIVGDPKQMPPTSFFAGSGPNVEDLALDDLDSILDDALALGIPSQHLQWHYRSQHESLIAFSNRTFYDNKMYTFPSANDRERHVTAVHVEGVYKNSTNVKEAEAIVAEIVRRFHDDDLKGQSIGVVTFNVKQQILIENLLAKQFQEDPSLDAWASNTDDPIFVKNLENVQGDERDVILFSIGYGPDEQGRVSMNFGPINQVGGGKRLNVAFSRARVTMTVFTSLYSTDIRVTENSPDGLVAFKDFLHFAEGHRLPPETHEPIQDADVQVTSGILNSICCALKEAGFQCIPMVGRSDFRVDLAVVDPYNDDQYLMGILLDGEGYRQTENTRDREVAQIGVLQHLGWELRRIWTIDWWDNRDRVLNRLLTRLETLKEASKQRHEAARAAEEAHQKAVADQASQAKALREELERQSVEVMEEDQAGERAEKEVRIVVSSPADTAAVGKVEPPVNPVSQPGVSEAGENVGEAVRVTGAGLPETNAAGDAKEVYADLDGNAAKIDVDHDADHQVSQTRPDDTVDTPVDEASELKAEAELAQPEVEIDAEAFNASSQVAEADMVKTSDSVNMKPAGDIELETDTAGTGADKGTACASKTAVTEAGKDAMPKSLATQNLIEPVPYTYADDAEQPLSASEYVLPENRELIGQQAIAILEAEALILRDLLIRKLMASFGVNKSAAVSEATERAIRAAKIKTTRRKGIVFCWAPDQDPKAYYGLRVANERLIDEICIQELCNAIVYVLQEQEELSQEDLVREASRVLGYKRLGKNLEATLTEGVKFARSTGAIVYVRGGTFRLPSKGEQEES